MSVPFATLLYIPGLYPGLVFTVLLRRRGGYFDDLYPAPSAAADWLIADDLNQEVENTLSCQQNKSDSGGVFPCLFLCLFIGRSL